MRPRVAVGVMAHDEAATIGAALGALLSQWTPSADIAIVAVVSSGSRDGTDAIVERWRARDARLRLLREPVRGGKARAVDLFLRSFRGADLFVLTNADVELEPGALEALLAPFADPRVGMTGGRVIPRESARSREPFAAFGNRVLWALHHRVAIRAPKLGETVALRPVVEGLPADVVADEAWLEWKVRERGLQLAYVPEARVRNAAPEALGDFFAVRRRNAAAHWRLRRHGHCVATWQWRPMAAAVADLARAHARGAYAGASPRAIPAQLLADAGDAARLGGLVLLEGAARGLGIFDAIRDPQRHVCWRRARSARRPLGA